MSESGLRFQVCVTELYTFIRLKREIETHQQILF